MVPTTQRARHTAAVKKYEDHAYVLDFAEGMSTIIHDRQGPIVQAIGESNLTFLEILMTNNCRPAVGERIAIGRENRQIVVSVLGKLDHKDLSSAARANLSNVAEQLVRTNSKRFEELVSEDYFPREKLGIRERGEALDIRKVARRLAAELLREQTGKLILLSRDGWHFRPRVVGRAASYAKAMGGGPVGNRRYLGGTGTDR